MLRVLVGENEARQEFNEAAKNGGTVSWIVPKAAQPGDTALFLFNRSLFTATGVVRGTPAPTMHGRRSAFHAEVGDLELLERPIPLEEVARRIPGWEWPSYPRSFTSPSPDVAGALLELLGFERSRHATPPTNAAVGSADTRETPRGEDAAARWAALLPRRLRQTAARALSKSVIAAHALADTCWTLTSSADFVRLNVGQPLAFTLYGAECDLIVMDDPAMFRSLSRLGLAVQRGQIFKKAPGTVRLDFPLESLAEVHARVWQSHVQAMGIAASKQRATAHRGYSTGLVEHLRALGFDVPDSNCPEAVALRANRETAATSTTVEPFVPHNLEDGRRYVTASIVRRRGQGEFRDAVLRAYAFGCAVSGCDVLDVLEAAHIVSYRGESTNHVQNGVLLRSDLHVLFDVGLLEFDAQWRVRLDESLKGTTYWEYERKPIRMPKETSCRPSREAVLARKGDRP